MKFAIKVMPLQRPVGTLSATPASRRSVLPTHKFAISAELDETVQAVVSRAETQLHDLYGLDTDLSYFCRVKDTDGADIAMNMRLGDIVSETTPAAERSFTVHQNWLDHQDTLPANSPLRPAMSAKRKYENYSKAEKDDYRRVKAAYARDGESALVRDTDSPARTKASTAAVPDSQASLLTPEASSMPPPPKSAQESRTPSLQGAQITPAQRARPTSAQRPKATPGPSTETAPKQQVRASPFVLIPRTQYSVHDDDLLSTFSQTDADVAAELERESNMFIFQSSPWQPRSPQQIPPNSQIQSSGSKPPRKRVRLTKGCFKKVCWEDIEDDAIVEGFNEGLSAEKIRKKNKLGRTASAIRARKALLQNSRPELFTSSMTGSSQPTPSAARKPAVSSKRKVRAGEPVEPSADESDAFKPRPASFGAAERPPVEDELAGEEGSDEDDDDDAEAFSPLKPGEEAAGRSPVMDEVAAEGASGDEEDDYETFSPQKIDNGVPEDPVSQVSTPEHAAQPPRVKREPIDEPSVEDDLIHDEVDGPLDSDNESGGEEMLQDDLYNDNAHSQIQLDRQLAEVDAVEEDADQAVQDDDESADEEILRDDLHDDNAALLADDRSSQESLYDKDLPFDTARNIKPDPETMDGIDEPYTRTDQAPSSEPDLAILADREGVQYYDEQEGRQKLMRYLRPDMSTAKIAATVTRVFRHAASDVIEWHKRFLEVKRDMLTAEKGSAEMKDLQEQMGDMIYYRDERRPDYWMDDRLMPERGGAVVVPRTEPWEVVPVSGQGRVVGEVEDDSIVSSDTIGGHSGGAKLVERGRQVRRGGEVDDSVLSSDVSGVRLVDREGRLRSRRARKHAVVAAKRRESNELSRIMSGSSYA